MKMIKFYTEAERIGNDLIHIRDHVRRTVEVLERLLNAEDEIEVSEWAVRAGKILVTFTSPVEIGHGPGGENHLQAALTALFPTCRYSGTLLEIEASELL